MLSDPEVAVHFMLLTLEDGTEDDALEAFETIRHENLTPREEALLRNRIRDLKAAGELNPETVTALLGLRLLDLSR